MTIRLTTTCQMPGGRGHGLSNVSAGIDVLPQSDGRVMVVIEADSPHYMLAKVHLDVEAARALLAQLEAVLKDGA